jgi:hypothetical protein
MNPPTPGHLELIKTMINKALELSINKAYIITSSSLDGKNPVPCSSETIPIPKKNSKDTQIIERLSHPDLIYKSSVLTKMIDSYKQKLSEIEPDISKKTLIQNFNVIVLCSKGSPFGFIYNIVKNDYIDIGIQKINMIFIVGRDRADFLDTVVDNFRNKDYVNSIDGIILEREGMNEAKTQTNVKDIKPSAYSATLIRNLVKSGNRDQFEEVYNQYLSKDDIYKLYETIQLGMQMSIPKKPDEDENPRSKYFDGRNPDGSRLLPVINRVEESNNDYTPQIKYQRTDSSGGSKKRKRKRKRKTRKNKIKTRKNKRKYSRRTM